MKCSVIIATYNGEKYILRQLDSLLQQTRTPDEVLIFDDASTDHTAETVKNYIETNGLDHWVFYQNTQNYGWKANFMKHIHMLQGSLCFFCDQDDEWLPDKLAHMENAMMQNTDIQVLACDYEEILEAGSIKKRHYRGKETKQENISSYPLRKSFFMNPRPGCTYAVRRDFLIQLSDYWKDSFPHDEFIWITAALGGKAYMLNEVLVRFYRHNENSSDVRYKDIPMQKKLISYMIEALHTYTSMMKSGVITPLPKAEKYVKEALKWCNKRQQLMETRNPFLWLMLMPWWGFYNSVPNLFSDLYLVLFGKFSR